MFQKLKFSMIVALCALAAFAGGYELGSAREPVRITPLFATGETILGEPVAYPAGKPKLTGAVVTMAPGQETGWHTHGVPLAGMILEGELTVDYGDKGKRTYKTGEALVESMSTPHNGTNTGSGPMRLFVLYIGAEGLATGIPVQPPAPKP